MTLLDRIAPEPAPPSASNSSSRKGWFGQLLLRLHFYAGIFIGPFILIAALSGALYAVSPQLEQAVYDKELHAPAAAAYFPWRTKLRRPTPTSTTPNPRLPCAGTKPRGHHPGDVCRGKPGSSETGAIFIDPATAEVRGDLTAYGTSGALPLRKWISQVHRNLQLGEPGRSL